jgi:hypothetical protein
VIAEAQVALRAVEFSYDLELQSIILEGDSLQVVNVGRMTQTSADTDNCLPIYKSFFLVGRVGKLGISKEWQIQQLIVLLRH